VGRPIAPKLVEKVGRATLRQPEPTGLPRPIAFGGPSPLKLTLLGQATQDVLDVVAWRKATRHRTYLGYDLVTIGHQEGLSRLNRT